MDIIKILSDEFKIRTDYVQNIVNLIDNDNTIPFIARYRKEMTGSLGDQVLREVSDRLSYLRNLEKRKEEIISSITEQEKMTDDIMKDILDATTLARLEDIYRPYKQKRHTKVTIAKEKGLESLANTIFMQDIKTGDINDLANDYIDIEKGVNSTEEVIAGAMDIIAEMVSDSPEARAELRDYMHRSAKISSVNAKEEDSVYSMYYDYSEPVSKVPPHRILAMNRGVTEEF